MSKNNMATKHLLVPYDGSNAADNAFDAALELTLNDNAKLSVVSWIPSQSYTVGYTLLKENKLQSKIKNLVEKAEKADVKFQHESFRYGGVSAMSPPTETIPELIVSYAKDNQVDLIVMGSRGLKGLKKKLLGSVSEEVSQRAECQVMIIK